jgi:predicted ATP-binding protein involved in virulence
LQLNRLTLTQFRAFEQATFEFHPGMNLLVGINGVGKSTVLDAIRIMLSQALPKLTASKSKPIAFETTDIMSDRSSLTAELRFEAANLDLTYLLHEPREKYAVDPKRQGKVRDQAYDLPERHDLTSNGKSIPRQLKKADSQPLALYFSTRRSLPIMAAPTKQSSAGNQAAAFADALTHRELRLREFAEWWLVQEALANDKNPLPKHRLDALKTAVMQFLDTFTHLRAVRDPQTTLLLEKEGVTLDVRQLSDGERSVLALVLDLARRLSQSNPTSEDSLQGKAVVLIDELDLHLHPRWQRTIIDKLTQTFPNCQFIATTHSPQIIGEVSAESIIMIESGQPPYRPDQSLGMDSNWVLRHLMASSERDIETQQELERIEAMIQNRRFPEATEAIKTLSELGQFPELVRLQTRIDRISRLGR